MEPRGFIHSMMDVKVLILYVVSRVLYPVDAQKIYELCYQDDCLSYFDVQEALPQMVKSGHLECRSDGTYVITDKGRETSDLVEDSLAYPVAQRALLAVERYNREFGLKKTLGSKTLEFLEKQPFRGNIRELQNLIQRLMITTDYQIIEVRDVLMALAYDQKEEGGSGVPDAAPDQTAALSGLEESCSLKTILDRQEEAVLRAYRERYGSTRKMAELLRISQSSVVRKLNQYGIE